MLNPSKEMVVDCYVDAYFAELWGHDNTKDDICDKSRTGFVVIFYNCPLLWVSKLQTDIDLYTRHYECVSLSCSFRDLLTLKRHCKISD